MSLVLDEFAANLARAAGWGSARSGGGLGLAGQAQHALGDDVPLVSSVPPAIR
jgi:hypothetical protein